MKTIAKHLKFGAFEVKLSDDSVPTTFFKLVFGIFQCCKKVESTIDLFWEYKKSQSSR